MPTEHFADVGGVRVRYVEEGQGQPVLLVHGVAGWAENFSPTIAALAGSGFRAIACDLPGFGKSGPSERRGYFDHPDSFYVRFIRQLLDALGLERVHLVGHSMGGTIAAASAAALPGRLRSLTLIAPGAFGRTVPFSFRLSSLPTAALLARLWPTALVRESVAACFYDRSVIPASVYEQALRNARAGASVEFVRVMRYGVTLRGVRRERLEPWDAAIRGIRLPTLVVWGKQDAVVPIADLDEVRGRLPHASVVLIDRAGHLVQLERPAEVNDALIRFLGSVDQQRVPAARTLNAVS